MTLRRTCPTLSVDSVWHLFLCMAALVLLHGILSGPEAFADEQVDRFVGSETGRSRPNILFIFSDDHATAAISAYGGNLNETPNIDRIAREGAVFRNTFCANSICGPSRACILTGLHSHKNGFLRNGDRFDGSQFTFPQQLQSSGYQTALIGKWHLGSDPTGFDHWEILPGQGNYYNPDFLTMDGGRHREQGYVSDLITNKTLDWLKEQSASDKPFLMMCQHKAPHRNWSPAIRHLGKFDSQSIAEPSTLFDDYSNRSELLKENEMTLADHFSWSHDAKFQGENRYPEYFGSRHKNREYLRMTAQQRERWDEHYEPQNQAFITAMEAGKLTDDDVTRWKYQRYIKDYLSTIAAVDESIGRLLDYLDESGLADNTIVIYSSDQGFYLGEHGWYDKRWMFEQSLQMPFVIRWPGRIDAGSRPSTIIQNIDFAPTFLDIAEQKIPTTMDGISLKQVFAGDGEVAGPFRDTLYYAYYENGGAHHVAAHDGVRGKRYKLMHFPRTREYQLFDLVKDPDELRNVADESSYLDVKNEMVAELADARKRYKVNTAAIPATRKDEERWWARENKLRQRVQNAPVDLVFLGDSITQGWEGAGKDVWKEFYSDRDALNLGISGDRTEHVLMRIRTMRLDKLQPEVMVLLIGTNNTGHLMQDPTEVAEGIRTIIEQVRKKSPRTQILLHSIFPRGDSPNDPYRLNNDAINRLVEPMANDKDVHWIDIDEQFLNPDGSMIQTMTHDQLHLTPKGYRTWATAIEPKLQSLLSTQEEVEASVGQ